MSIYMVVVVGMVSGKLPTPPGPLVNERDMHKYPYLHFDFAKHEYSGPDKGIRFKWVPKYYDPPATPADAPMPPRWLVHEKDQYKYPHLRFRARPDFGFDIYTWQEKSQADKRRPEDWDPHAQLARDYWQQVLAAREAENVVKADEVEDVKPVVKVEGDSKDAKPLVTGNEGNKAKDVRMHDVAI
ncbi:hypothetical protein LTR15_000742 [Elasticomyces elasticus]|nr:hypothetical protein LTR15_000742 [Elasticomyces elasticus]